MAEQLSKKRSFAEQAAARGINHELRNTVQSELEQIYGPRVFRYGTHVGTVADMVRCPELSSMLEQGIEAASAWLELYDETDKVTLEEEVAEEDDQKAGDEEPDKLPELKPEKPEILEVVDLPAATKPEPEPPVVNEVATETQNASAAVVTKEAAGERELNQVTDIKITEDRMGAAEAVTEEPARLDAAPLLALETTVDVELVGDSGNEKTGQVNMSFGKKAMESLEIIQPVNVQVETFEPVNSERVESSHDRNQTTQAVKSKEASEGYPRVIEPGVQMQVGEVVTPEIEVDEEVVQAPKIEATPLPDSFTIHDEYEPVEAAVPAESETYDTVGLDSEEESVEPEATDLYQPAADTEAVAVTELDDELEVNEDEGSLVFSSDVEPQTGMVTSETDEPAEPMSVIEQVFESELDTQNDAKDAPETNRVEQSEAEPAGGLVSDVVEVFAEVIGDPEQEPGEEATEEWARSQLQAVIERIEILETATTEQECREALEQIKAELYILLRALGYAAPEARVNDLMKYDIMALRQVLAQLLQSLTQTEQDTKVISLSTRPTTRLAQYIVGQTVLAA